MLLKSPTSHYNANFLSSEEANNLFDHINMIEGWRKNAYKGHKLARETIVFATKEIVDNLDKFKIPDIWGKDVVVQPFPRELLPTLELLCKTTGAKYNIVLGNRYLKAKDKIAFHSDNEEFGNTQTIASISLGVSRTFTFLSKVNDGEKISLKLKHGSLLFMGENCQENYTHGMVKETIKADDQFGKTRINLTFRVWNYI